MGEGPHLYSMLSLKIDNQFIALPDETEISIEASNPIFSDAGAKTYLFEIPVESLRYIIGNADDIYGESLYDVLEGKRAEIYIDGVQFFSGVVNLEDEISIEDGKIAVSIASGNLEFAQMISGMNCRDVKQSDDVVVGYRYTDVDATWTFEKEKYDHTDESIFPYEKKVHYELPDEFVVFRNKSLPGVNVSATYPDKRYCTLRACCAKSEKETYPFFIWVNTGNNALNADMSLQINYSDPEVFTILEGARRNSGICFYVMYFLECLAKHLGISVQENALGGIEDMRRLAFVNMGCRVKRKSGTRETVTFEAAKRDIGGIRLIDEFAYSDDGTAVREQAIATSENFPDAAVSDAISCLENGFGVKFLYNAADGSLRILFLKDILRSSDVHELSAAVYAVDREHNRHRGFRLVYDGEGDQFEIPSHSSVARVSSYGEAAAAVSAFNRKLYIDETTGNAYVVKVEEEANSSGDEENLKPSLFEVGGYSAVRYGDCSDDSSVEEVRIPFMPIENNLVKPKGSNEAVQAFFIPEEVEASWKEYASPEGSGVVWEYGDKINKRSISPQFRFAYADFLGSNSDASTKDGWLPADAETVVNSYDTGLMLGVMRGPGSDASTETFDENFDGEGNYRVSFTASGYAFTSDSIDHLNRDFDYNGDGSGIGGDVSVRFSLKLRAGKYDKDGNPIKDADGTPIVVQDKARAERGLYDKFWKEYAYFTVNKKVLRMSCGMEISDILNLDWTKRYKIGEWTGFIAGYSFNVNKDGMSEVELEMYYL